MIMNNLTYPTSLITSSWTVNQVLRTYPNTVGVLNAFGIDTCCGGSDTLLFATNEAGIDIRDVLDALDAQLAAEVGAGDRANAAARAVRGDACSCAVHAR